MLYTSIALVAVVLIANLHTLFRMLVSLVFSHRRHLMRAVSKLDTLKAEGYLHTLKGEVMLMVDMTRLVAIVDGLDTCEQEKVLSVLDAVNTLFTDSSAPFIIVLAIDPHIITKVSIACLSFIIVNFRKAIELHVHRVFSESSISGHDYLRNIVHLPFYLQNSGLRKVKQAQQVAERARNRSGGTLWVDETDSIPTSRRLSVESGVSQAAGMRRNPSKGSRRLLKQSDSIASSIASNLNRAGGAQDLTKVLLTDDYFSDINPRSMRRLMNVVYITGRLLKAFHIDFNWYHLASWINIIEQWPYRASWIIMYHEVHEEAIEDKISLKDLYDK
ncbi:hypothetical protein HAZT_HAZT003678 [Hyalella azteca]|uniref:KAP NTPase domain-containing protein n=1 Tax=Hyalella azteca TaxID=294128 RepID=A0A6A0H4Z4_HYAAZ|nr:hypothetical protein HAZT_HAZT003678 [Hyalella azteca]